MFDIISGGRVLGYSEPEQGDPPMGVAFGRFIPAEGFSVFVQTVPTDATDGDRVRIWNNLEARSANGVVLQCAGVGVRYDLDGKFACEVEVLGIDSPLYQEMFPHHVEAYDLRVQPQGPIT